MPIIRKSVVSFRDEVLHLLAEKKKTNPAFSVIDVGGSRSNWCDTFVDGYIDLFPARSEKKTYLGDVNEEGVWREVAHTNWDFSICTHLLEDIRRPDYVLTQLMRISRAGYIAVPSKHVEMSSIRSHLYVGYCHHRWIFSLDSENNLRIIAKWPDTSYLARSNCLFRWMSFSPLSSRILSGLGFRPAGESLSWLDRRRTDPHRFELNFLWESQFSYTFVNGDYAGDDKFKLVNLYRDSISDGL